MDVVERLDISDNGFVFDPATGTSFRINETGRMLLEGWRSGGTDEDLIDTLVEAFGIAPKEARRDVSDFRLCVNRLGLMSAGQNKESS